MDIPFRKVANIVGHVPKPVQGKVVGAESSSIRSAGPMSDKVRHVDPERLTEGQSWAFYRHHIPGPGGTEIGMSTRRGWGLFQGIEGEKDPQVNLVGTDGEALQMPLTAIKKCIPEPKIEDGPDFDGCAPA